MQNQKNSILWRPLWKPTKVNEETWEKQHDKEQARLKFRIQQQKQRQERLMDFLYPDSRVPTYSYDDQLPGDTSHTRRGCGDCSAVLESEYMQTTTSPQCQGTLNAGYGGLPRQTEYPVTGRNAYDVEAMLYNKTMAHEVKLRQWQERRAEQEQRVTDMQYENGYWNLGASSDRYVAPKHRIQRRPRGTPPQDPNLCHPIWAWEADQQQHQQHQQQQQYMQPQLGEEEEEELKAAALKVQKPPREMLHPWTWQA